MKAICEEIKNYFYGKESGRWILSALLITALYGLLFLFSVIRFDTNDDNTIINSIIYAAGQPEASAGFMYINYFLGLFLAFFYRIFRNVPWYDLYSVAVLAFSGVIIFKSILKEGYRNHKSLAKMLVLLLTLFIILLASVFQKVQFTTTAAASGTAALVTYLCLDEKGVSRIADLLIIWVFLHLSIFHRETVGYVILAFFMLLIGVDVVKCLYRNRSLRPMAKKLVFSMLLIASLFATTIYSEHINAASEESEDFTEYSALRVQYMDYNVISYQDNPAVFEEVGWDEVLCIMVSNWYFMDERYNTEALRTIIAASGQLEEGKEQEHPITKVGAVWRELLRNEKAVLIELCFLAVLIFDGGFLYFRNRREENTWYFLLMLGAWVGGALMYLYLSLKGRLPFRVFETVMLPMALLTVISILRISEQPKGENKKDSFEKITKAIAALAILMASGFMLPQLFDKEMDEALQEERNRQILMDDFAASNQGNIYIYDNTLIAGDPIFYKTTDNMVDNTFFWGGTSMFSRSYYAKLKRNGLKELHSEDWFRDNVYYMTRDQGMIYVLNKYLSGVFEDVSFEVVGSVGDIFLVKFTN